MTTLKVGIRFERLTADDCDPDTSYLEQDYTGVTVEERAKYKAQDAERLAGFRRGEWSFIGIRARAHITITRDRHSTTYTLDSPGLWGIESDSCEEYLASVFAEECAVLRADIKALKNAQVQP